MYADIIKKMRNIRKTRIVPIIYIVLLYLMSVMAICNTADVYSKNSFWKSDEAVAEYMYSNDLEENGNTFRITGEDPYIVYAIQPNIYTRGIINFSSISAEDVAYCIFLIPKMDETSNWETINTIQKKGSDSITFKIASNYEMHYIRVDYEASPKAGIIEIENVGVIAETISSSIHAVFNYSTIVKIVFLTIAYIVLIVFSFLFKNKFKSIFVSDDIRHKCEFIIIIALPIVLFWEYISGNSYFLFTDVGEDSFGQLYPNLVHIADRIKAGQWSGGYYFIRGLGTGEKSIFPGLTNWVSFFGREKVAYLLSVSIVVKVVISGILAYKYVELWGITDEKRLILALGYEFNAMLIIRSCWESFPNIAVLVILWLYCFELLYRKKRRYSALIFCFVSESFFVQSSLYNCILYTGIFSVYIIVRTLCDGAKFSEICKYLVSFCVFAMFGMSDTIRNSFADTVSSERFTSGTNLLSDRMDYLVQIQWENLLDAFLRTIGQTIGGIQRDSFIGIGNYLDGPAMYCGIFTFLLVPVAYYNLNKVKKSVFGVGICVAILYICIPFIRLVLSGFSDADNYKLSSFWIVVMLFLIVLEALGQDEKRKYKRKSVYIFDATVVITLFLLLFAKYSGKVVDRSQWWIVAILCLFYMIGVNEIYIYNNTVWRKLLVLATMFEVFFLSYGAINNRASIDKAELIKLHYSDVYSALRFIDSEDNAWHRVEIYPYSVSMCDSLVQNYYGASSYVGGTGIGKGIINYYHELGLAYDEHDRVLCGTLGNFYANALLGMKYIILNDMDNFRYGSVYSVTCGDAYIYENKYALPIGYCYDDSISESEFLLLSYKERNETMLKKCVVLDDEFSGGYSKSREIFVDDDSDIEIYSVNEYKHDDLLEKIYVGDQKGRVLVVDVKWKSGVDDIKSKQNGFFPIFWSEDSGDVNYQDFSWNGVIELTNQKIDYLWLDEQNIDDVESVIISAYDPDEYYSDSKKSIERLKRNGIETTEISQDVIKGKLHADNNGYFVTSIPYDTKWEVYIDGIKQDTIVVNTGFLGCTITKGEHDVKILYNHPTWVSDNLNKIIGFGSIAICSFILFYRKHKFDGRKVKI